MITDPRELLILRIAGILDWPSVYMGGPSQHNQRKAERIIDLLEEEGLINEVVS